MDMMNGFKNILVPVDFSANTDVAVHKAIEFSSAGVTKVHLLHVVVDSTGLPQFNQSQLRRIELKIWEGKKE